MGPPPDDSVWKFLIAAAFVVFVLKPEILETWIRVFGHVGN
jgi:hypothetical protein